METVVYGLMLVAIVLVVVWFFINDRKRPDEPTTGLFAMRVERPQEPSPTATNRRAPRNR
jgi:hypothetical protein